MQVYNQQNILGYGLNVISATAFSSCLVRLAGVEPAACGFEVRRSIRLSYRRIQLLAITYIRKK